jgi:hypothetical protein
MRGEEGGQVKLYAFKWNGFIIKHIANSIELHTSTHNESYQKVVTYAIVHTYNWKVLAVKLW